MRTLWSAKDIQLDSNILLGIRMQLQVQVLVAQCVVCDHVQVSFNASMTHLQPLSIMGLYYKWSLDFAGPFLATPRHNKYALMMIEHFSKWIELVALPNKFCEGATYSFLDCVLSHFGASSKVLMIEYHIPSRDHLGSDSLVERMILTIKRGLWMYSLKKGHHGDWNLQLPWIEMGYRFSKQASLASFSPYYLLFGRDPILPKAIQVDVDIVLANMDNPDMSALVSEHGRSCLRG
jgi:hypothetical protein